MGDERNLVLEKTEAPVKELETRRGPGPGGRQPVGQSENPPESCVRSQVRAPRGRELQPGSRWPDQTGLMVLGELVCWVGAGVSLPAPSPVPCPLGSV